MIIGAAVNHAENSVSYGD